MIINGTSYAIQDVSRVLTVPDCNVVKENKIGSGHGEGKFYFGSKDGLQGFVDVKDKMNCFFLKADLQAYMLAAEHEYKFPSQEYNKKEDLASLWKKRFDLIQEYPDVIFFSVDFQQQIGGARGYFNSSDKAYKLFRILSLPLISYISIMRLQSTSGETIYYWKLFVDFKAIEQKRNVGLVLNYGTKNQEKSLDIPEVTPDTTGELLPQTGRDAAAQAKYRRLLLDECPFCPITGITDERLLIASHIKPFVASSDSEAFDPKNGFILSPLYDKLFDQGFITFDSDRRLVVSNWLSPKNQTCCQIKNGTFIQRLPWDEQREQYLVYHRQCVFKG